VLIHRAVMQEAVNPVDTGVGEGDECETTQHQAWVT
jgi:hypothetical protein